MCTLWKRSDPARELGLAEYRKIVPCLNRGGIKSVEIFGGDIFLKSDLLFPLLDLFHENGIKTFFPTNAVNIDNQACESLALSMVDAIYVSLDAVGDVHDDIRGRKGTTNRVREFVGRFLEIRGARKTPRLIVNCTISKLNVSHIHEVLEFAIRSGVDSLALEPVGEINRDVIESSIICGVRPTPYYIPQEGSVLLSTQQAIDLKKEVRKMKKYSLEKSFDLNSRNIDMMSIKNFENGTFPGKPCCFARTFVHMDPFGRMIACPFYGEYVLGNLLDVEFSKIWRSDIHRRFIHAVSTGDVQICHSCVYNMERNQEPWTIIKHKVRDRLEGKGK
jgi:radical SAM protein with 4Fe4S-binding SPASM domain